MAQFRLPANSKIRPGKLFKASAGAKQVRAFKIYRFDPEAGENPRVDTYEVDMASCGPMVLDALIKIKNEIDPTLTFRRSCREGTCGSCAMNIDGLNTLACTRANEDIRGTIKIYPLPHLPVVKDLVADMDPFFDKWARARGHFKPSAGRADALATVDPASPARREADAGIECIGCGVCYSACDVVAWNPDYLGPAALNRAWTLVNDVRDRGNPARIAAVSTDAGCHACHTHMSCTNFCPKGIAPTYAIAGLKRAVVAKAGLERPGIERSLCAPDPSGSADQRFVQRT